MRLRHVERKPDEQIMYIDANNLYGMALALPLCTGGYKRMKKEEFDKIDWAAQELDQPTGSFGLYTIIWLILI